MKPIISPLRSLPRINHLSNRDLFLLALFFVLQILDGTLTWYALKDADSLGLEGNVLVRNAMVLFGVGPGLFLVKSMCCIIIVFMYNVCRILCPITPVIRTVLSFAIACYLTVVISWIYIIMQGW